MIGYLVRRVLHAAVTILVAVALVFIAVRSIPGNPLLAWNQRPAKSVCSRMTDAATTLRMRQSMTGWFWLAAVAALVVLASTVLALRLVRTWPEMGSRYDAPTGARAGSDADAPAGPAERPTENIDIWKALDEGRDPTA